MIKTIDDLIDMFGGTTAVANMFGVGQSAVSNVRARGRIPHRWRLRLLREAEKRGLKLDPRLLETEAA